MRNYSEKSNMLVTFLIICMGCNLLYFAFPFPPVYWRFLILMVYGVFLVKGLKIGFSAFEKSLLLLSCYQILWYIFSGTESGISLFVNMLVALLSFPVFGTAGRYGYLSTNFISLFAVLLFICAIPYYTYSETLVHIEKNLSADRSITVNASNIFLMLLPTVFILKNKKISFALVCCTVFFLLLSAKRGNIVAAAIPLLLYIRLLFKTNNNLRRRLIIIAAIGVAFYYFSGYVMNNDFLMSRYEATINGDSSHRDVIYSTLWERWINSSFEQFLFGHGFLASMKLNSGGFMAHNDWVEILADFGLVGALFYLFAFLFLFMNIKAAKDIKVKFLLTSIFFIWFIKSMFSMGFFSEQLSFMAISYGWYCGRKAEQNNYQSKLVNDNLQEVDVGSC